jgi:DNA-binding MarR family transcriptional regulator
MKRDNIDAVLRSLRRVNLQGSFFGQTVAIRFGLSESDIETLEALMEMGASTAGRLGELTGLTSGAITRVIDRLEQAGYVRRVPDPADRRRVIVEVVPEKVAAVKSTLDRVGSASADEIGRYTDAQLTLITDFLTRMEQITRDEATSLREHSPEPSEAGESSEHVAPLGGLTSARLLIRSGLSEVLLRPGTTPSELYRAEFQGATPQVRLRDGRVIVQYRGGLFDWRKRTATLGLNTTIPWTIEIVGGVGQVDADLREIETTRFEVTGGSQRIQFELGTPRGEGAIRIVGCSSTIRIERPAAVPVRLSVVGGSGQIDLDGTRLGPKGGRATMESPGWAKTSDRYSVEVVGGSQSIEVVGRPA